jgi:flagellar biosynthesis/type III secretory pathway protein FliH
MLHLTPIEEIVIGKELIEIGKKGALQAEWQKSFRKAFREGFQQGLLKGELIGEIRVMQKVLRRRVSPISALARKGQKTLKAMLAELEAELSPIK